MHYSACPRRGQSEMIVQLKRRDPIGAQTAQALLQAALDGARAVAEVLGFEPNLGGDMRPRRKPVQVTADRFLGGTVAVCWSGIDPVDTSRHRAAQHRVADR